MLRLFGGLRPLVRPIQQIADGPVENGSSSFGYEVRQQLIECLVQLNVPPFALFGGHEDRPR